jgi:hypothetical protein
LKKNIDLDLDELLDKHYYRKKLIDLKRRMEEETNLPKIEYRKKKNRASSDSSSDQIQRINEEIIDNSGNKKNSNLNKNKEKTGIPTKKKQNIVEPRKIKPKKQVPVDSNYYNYNISTGNIC